MTAKASSSPLAAVNFLKEIQNPPRDANGSAEHRQIFDERVKGVSQENDLHSSIGQSGDPMVGNEDVRNEKKPGHRRDDRDAPEQFAPCVRGERRVLIHDRVG
ncbi:hypothetical protein QPK87_11190 [Kamptonema cortianum]|nr:hypothetical protein [Kamptonema cortianum]